MADTAFELIPEGSLTQDRALRAVVAAASVFGTPAEPAELIRLGTNAVFRLPGGVIARVSSGSSAYQSASLQIDVAGWLAKHGLPAATAIEGPQPQAAYGLVVTFWHSVSETTRFGTLRDVASLVQTLHRLPNPEFDLPPFEPFRRMEGRLSTLQEAITAQEYVELEQRLSNTADAWSALEFEDVGHIHGDANIGNVILDRTGHAVLMDLDSFAHGPRVWDSAKTAVYYERFGWHTAEEYDDYCEIVGIDVITTPWYPVLASTVELLMTLWLSRQAAHDEQIATELRKRARAIRLGLPRNDWKPY